MFTFLFVHMVSSLYFWRLNTESRTVAGELRFAVCPGVTQSTLGIYRPDSVFSLLAFSNTKWLLGALPPRQTKARCACAVRSSSSWCETVTVTAPGWHWREQRTRGQSRDRTGPPPASGRLPPTFTFINQQGGTCSHLTPLSLLLSSRHSWKYFLWLPEMTGYWVLSPKILNF